MTAALRRWFGLFTLLAFISGLSVPLFMATHARWDDDLACGSGVFSAGHKTAVSQTAPATKRAEHCAVCHWLRAMGSASAAAAFVALPGFASLDLPIALPADAPSDVAAFVFTTRGPPARSL